MDIDPPSKFELVLEKVVFVKYIFVLLSPIDKDPPEYN
jgi:hypothetical protein